MSEWKTAVKNAKHHKAIGQTRVYLHRETDVPWELVTKVEHGSTYRYNTPVSLHFTAKHSCGLTFEWSYDVEQRDANGKGEFDVDVAGLRKVISKLPHAQAAELAKLLTLNAEGLDKRGKEYQDAAMRQFGQATALRSLL